MKAYTLIAALMLAVPVMAQQAGGSSARHGKAACTMQLLTDLEGVDFNSTLQQAYRSVKDRWFANMPPDIEKGIQGVNKVEFRILRDGNVPKDSVKMVLRSGKDELDTASLRGISEAAPVSHLPEKFSQPYIVLRFTFYYNVEPPKI